MNPLIGTHTFLWFIKGSGRLSEHAALRMERASATALRRRPGSFAWHGWVGLGLIAVAWPLNWLLPGLRTHLLFFPLWLGYALAVDALVLRRRGTSIVHRSPGGFAMLFALSAPAWWLFEAFNLRTQNWEYVGAEHFSDLTYFALASVAFSTVMPAVFGTAELVRSFGWVERFRDGPRIPRSRRSALVLAGMGAVMLALVLAWPTYAYPFVWGAIFGLTEPLNVALGRPSLFDSLGRGDWRPAVSLMAGALLTGFFWELWNYYAYPKWVYHTPGVGFLYVFEMPIIGFIGYLPFALELYALFHLARWKKLELNL